MTEYKITWILKLFKNGFQFQKIVETKPKAIETNVTDDSIRLLKKMTKDGYDSINEIKASTRLGGA